MAFKEPSKAVEVYQIKVTLEGIQPPIWRRVQLGRDTTLAKFHMVLQRAMGWTNSHLHQFVIRGQYFAPRDVFSEFGGPKMGSETKTTLADVVSGPKSRMRYEYDMGDSWLHDIVVEKALSAEAGAQYPVCLAGARACPPEDCGGIRRLRRVARGGGRSTARAARRTAGMGGGVLRSGAVRSGRCE